MYHGDYIESEIVIFQNAIRKKMEKLSLYRSHGFKTLGLFIFFDEPPIPIIPSLFGIFPVFRI